jgi:hypothetical protein
MTAVLAVLVYALIGVAVLQGVLVAFAFRSMRRGGGVSA